MIWDVGNNNSFVIDKMLVLFTVSDYSKDGKILLPKVYRFSCILLKIGVTLCKIYMNQEGRGWQCRFEVTILFMLNTSDKYVSFQSAYIVLEQVSSIFQCRRKLDFGDFAIYSLPFLVVNHFLLFIRLFWAGIWQAIGPICIRRFWEWRLTELSWQHHKQDSHPSCIPFEMNCKNTFRHYRFGSLGHFHQRFF